MFRWFQGFSAGAYDGLGFFSGHPRQVHQVGASLREPHRPSGTSKAENCLNPKQGFGFRNKSLGASRGP